MGFGTVAGILFFVLVLFAAITSSIALTESAVSTFEDELALGTQKGNCFGWRDHAESLGLYPVLGYGPLACVKIIGMQFLDFFDFLTNSVMMPIAAIATCLLVSRVVGIKKHRRRSYVTARAHSGERRSFIVMIQYLCPIFATIILDQLRGKCIWVDFNVKRKVHFTAAYGGEGFFRNENGRPQWSAGKRIFCCLRTVSMISSSRQDAFSQE